MKKVESSQILLDLSCSEPFLGFVIFAMALFGSDRPHRSWHAVNKRLMIRRSHVAEALSSDSLVFRVGSDPTQFCLGAGGDGSRVVGGGEER